MTLSEQTRAILSSRTRQRRNKIEKWLPRTYEIPSDVVGLRLVAGRWYLSHDPFFEGIRKAVDHFVAEVQQSLKEHGLADPDAQKAARELVLTGAALLRRRVRGRNKTLTYIHAITYTHENQVGTPYLSRWAKELCLLDAAAQYVTVVGKDGLYYDAMLVQAEKFREQLLESLAKPQAGLMLEAYRTEVNRYTQLISAGWQKFLLQFQGFRRKHQRKPRPRQIPKSNVQQSKAEPAQSASPGEA